MKIHRIHTFEVSDPLFDHVSSEITDLEISWKGAGTSKWREATRRRQGLLDVFGCIWICAFHRLVNHRYYQIIFQHGDGGQIFYHGQSTIVTKILVISMG